jgi:hypothetical protein
MGAREKRDERWQALHVGMHHPILCTGLDGGNARAGPNHTHAF